MGNEIVPRIDPSVEPTDLDRLVVAKAIGNLWNQERVKPLEDKLKAELLEAKDRLGVDKMTTSKFLGPDAGMLYLARKKGKQGEDVERFYMYDIDKLVDWMDRERPETDGFASEYIEKFAEWHFRQTGEMPDGCALEKYRTEDVPDTYTPTLKPNAEYVRAAIQSQGGNLFESAERLMLGDGNGSY